MWAEELERWLPELLAPCDVHLIASSSDLFHQGEPTPKVTITSFRLATILQAKLAERNWQMVIVDESHTLCSTARATDSQQTEAAANLVERVPHVLLLSGTPSLSRPFSLWRQVQMLRPGLRRLQVGVWQAVLRQRPHLTRCRVAAGWRAEGLGAPPPCGSAVMVRRRRWKSSPSCLQSADGGYVCH